MLNKILNRRSERSYKNEQLDQNTINNIKDVINSAPTSINGNTTSAIFITDPELKKEISDLNWGQKHIVDAPLMIMFCADLYRTNISLEKNDMSFNELSEEYKFEAYDAALGDSFIAATMVQSYILDENLGACYIGGVRQFVPTLQQRLNLPDNVIPVVGLLVGHIDKQEDVKPKINKVFEEKYDIEQLNNDVNDYDEVMKEYYAKRSNNNKGEMTWTKASAITYKKMDSMYDSYIKSVNKVIKK